MKTTEEKWTAWLDGQLSGQELADFEATLPDKAAATAEKDQAQKLGALLKRELGAVRLTNEDFFNHQIQERIARECAEPEAVEAEDRISTWWTLKRLFLTGATALAAFVVFALIYTGAEEGGGGASSPLTNQLVKNARVDGTNQYATVTPFETQENKVTVLWTEGLKSLPADYAAK